MPGHWLACPVKANATVGSVFAAARGSVPASGSATASRLSRSDSASRNTTPARYVKWLRPTPAVHARSDSGGSAAVPAPSSSAPCSSSHPRYPRATSCNAAADLADSGRNLHGRAACPPRGSGTSAICAGSVTAIGRPGPAAQCACPTPVRTPSTAGYPCSTTCALVPDQPKPLTPASGGCSACVGHSIASAVTRNGSRCQSICGLGLRKCRCGGMIPCRIASTTFITPTTPAADSRWPMLVFTEPISSGRSDGRPRP